jgi:hypothetical protein
VSQELKNFKMKRVKPGDGDSDYDPKADPNNTETIYVSQLSTVKKATPKKQTAASTPKPDPSKEIVQFTLAENECIANFLKING